MDWANETWVKLYKHETANWASLPWQSRYLFRELLTRVDRSGQFGVTRRPAEGLANACRMPVEIASEGLRGLLEDGAATLDGYVLTLVNFVEAQEARTSGAEKQRRHRESAKSRKSGGSTVTTNNPALPIDQKRSDQDQRLLSSELDRARLDQESGAVVGGTVVERVFVYWQTAARHPHARLDPKRTKAIKAALALGYSEQQLQQAIAGCVTDPWHQGQNDRHQVFDGLELIFRDAAHVDKFIGYATRKNGRLSTEGFARHQEAAP